MALRSTEEWYWNFPQFNAPACFVGPIFHHRHVAKDGRVFYAPDWSRPEAVQRVELEESHFHDLNYTRSGEWK